MSKPVMRCLHGCKRWSRDCSGLQTCPRSTALTAAVLILMVLGSSVHAAPQHPVARRLLQITATSDTPVNINAGAGADAEPQPKISSTSQLPAAVTASSDSQVTAQSGPAFEAFKSIATEAISDLLHKGKQEQVPVALPAAAQPVTTIVVPPQQVAAVPTTTSGISLTTATPVTVASPINVTTPVKQKNVQLAPGKGKGGEDILNGLNALINLGNLGASSAAAAGSIAGAVAGFLNTFLPDCPPPIPGAPPIPGCQLIGGLGGPASSARPGSSDSTRGPSASGSAAPKASPKPKAAATPVESKASQLPLPVQVFQGIMGWP